MSRAVLVERPRSLRVVPVEPACPASGESVVRVAWPGIYGSDHEVFAGMRDGAFVRYPVTPGHEWSGTVVEVGDGVDPALRGKPVVTEPTVSRKRVR